MSTVPPRNAKVKIHGPFDVISRIGGNTIFFYSLPSSVIRESSLLIAVTDNVLQAITESNQITPQIAYSLVLVEIGIFGSVQGYKTCIKRQQVKSNWGPMLMRIDSVDSYDQIEFQSRLMIGGKPGFPADLVLNTRLKVDATLFTAPRGN
jgi:hypothetical protein